MPRFASRLRELPASALFMFLVFLVIPLWSLTFLEAPAALAARDGWPLTAVRLFVYIGGPLTLAATLLRRHFLFIPLFGVECAGLLYLLVVGEQSSAGGAAGVFRLVALAVATILGLVLANKDLLMPFLGKSSRSWRKAPRLSANARMAIRAGDGKGVVRAMMEDLSATGLAVALEADAGREALAGTELGGNIDVAFSVGSRELRFKAVVVRRKLEEGFLRLGLSVADEAAMQAIWDAVDSEAQGPGVDRKLQRIWIKSSARRVALGVWAVTMAGAYGSPACGQLSKSKRSGGGAVAVDEEARSIIADAYIYRGPVENTSGEHGFHSGELAAGRGFQAGGGRSQVAFTGAETACSDGVTVERAGDLWSQDKLLAAYAPTGVDFLATMLRSFQESEPQGLRRPKLPIHQDIVNRLGAGTMGHGWVLNLVRLRDDHIKLNYELDIKVAQPHLIVFAAAIHALQIRPEDVAAYQDEQAAFAGEGPHGCALISFLKRWIPRTSYKFAHTNIFDTGLPQPIWRFAEAKITRDLTTNPASPQPLQITGDLDNRYGQAIADGRRLTVVPMRFDRYRKVNGQLVKQGADRAFKTWKSDGIDEADIDPSGLKTKNQKFVNDDGLDLVERGDDGNPIPADDPVRACDETMTCAACHAATTDAVSDGNPLARIPANNFRHIGFGLDAPFGIARPQGQGVYSKWFERLQRRSSCGTVIK